MAELLSIPVAQLQLAADNPRKTFDDASIAELAQSIKTQGLLQPVLVRLLTPAKGKKAATYEVVCGARRTKAAQVAGLPELLCNVAELTDDQAFEAAVTENLQREDVKPMEEARAFAALIERGYTLQQLGDRFGKSHVHIWNRVQLAKATPELQEAIESGKIPLTYARELAKFPEHVQIEQAARESLGNWRSPAFYAESLLDNGENLKDAPFDIEKAGCASCEFNARVRKISDANICLNAEKYKDKVRALILEKIHPDRKNGAYIPVSPNYSHREAEAEWAGLLPDGVKIQETGYNKAFDIIESPDKPELEEIDREDYDSEHDYQIAMQDARDEYEEALLNYRDEYAAFSKKVDANPLRAIIVYGPRMGEMVWLEVNPGHEASVTTHLKPHDIDDIAAARAEITKEIMELAEQIGRNPVLASEKAYEVAREQINDLAMYKGIDSIDDQPALLDEEWDALYLHMVTERISFFPDNVRRAIMGKSYETFRFTPKQIEAALAVKQQLWPLAVRMFLKQSFQHVNGSSCSTQERYAWDKIAMALADVDYSEVAKVHDGYAAKLKKLKDRHSELVASLEKLKEVAQ